MGLIMWLIVGGVIGWLASLIMRTDGSQGIVLNIVVGIVGAFIGGMLLSRGDINNAPLTVTTFLVSLAGAVILLAIVNLVRRGTIRLGGGGGYCDRALAGRCSHLPATVNRAKRAGAPMLQPFLATAQLSHYYNIISKKCYEV